MPSSLAHNQLELWSQHTSWHFLDNQKKVQTFPGGGGLRPTDPTFKSAAVAASARQVRTLEPSRPLSRPPCVGSTWSMVWNVDYRTASSSPTRPADSGTFSPPGMPSLGFCRHYLLSFLEMRRKTCRKVPERAQKKVPESAGLVGGSGPLVEGSGPSLAQTSSFSSRAKNVKNVPKWVQNRWFGLKLGPEAC